MRHFKRFILAISAALCLSWGVPAVAAESQEKILDVLETCPAAQPLCVEMKGNLKWLGERQYDISQHPSVRYEDTKQKDDLDYAPVLIRVIGRLEGGPVQTYFLRLTYPNDLLNCNDFQAALIGRRSDARGMLLTRQGRFEETSSVIRWGDTENSFIISDDGKQVIPIVAPDWETSVWKMEPVIKPDGRVFWRKENLCLDINTGGLFKRKAAKECDAVNPVAISDAEIAPFSQLAPAAIREGAEASQFNSFRLPGTRWLIFLWRIACT